MTLDDFDDFVDAGSAGGVPRLQDATSEHSVRSSSSYVAQLARQREEALRRAEGLTREIDEQLERRSQQSQGRSQTP